MAISVRVKLKNVQLVQMTWFDFNHHKDDTLKSKNGLKDIEKMPCYVGRHLLDTKIETVTSTTQVPGEVKVALRRMKCGQWEVYEYKNEILGLKMYNNKKLIS